MRAAVVALVLLAAADQALYGLNGVIAWQDFVTRAAGDRLPGHQLVSAAAGETRLVRGNFPNLYLLANHRLLDGYVAIAPSKQLDYHQPNALRVAQVEYAHADFFTGAPVPEGSRAARPRLVSPAGRAAASPARHRRARQPLAGEATSRKVDVARDRARDARRLRSTAAPPAPRAS